MVNPPTSSSGLAGVAQLVRAAVSDHRAWRPRLPSAGVGLGGEVTVTSMGIAGLFRKFTIVRGRRRCAASPPARNAGSAHVRRGWRSMRRRRQSRRVGRICHHWRRTTRRDALLPDARHPPHQRIVHALDESVLPGHDDVVAAREPADLHQRRLGEQEQARDQGRRHHLGGEEQQARQHDLSLGDQEYGQKLERQQDGRGENKHDEGGVGRQAGNGRLDSCPGAPFGEPAEQVGERLPAPFLEHDDEGEQDLQGGAQHRSGDAPEGGKRRPEVAQALAHEPQEADHGRGAKRAAAGAEIGDGFCAVVHRL